MSKHISKGKFFSVEVVVDDERLKQFGKGSEIILEAVEEAANYHHTGILPRHFTPAAHDRYGYATRSKAYLKKKGGNPDLVRTGAMKAELLSKAAFRREAKGVTLQMYSRVLNLVPNMPANSNDYYVKHSSSTARGYPNLKRELRLTTDDEREEVAVVAAKVIEDRLAPSKS